MERVPSDSEVAVVRASEVLARGGVIVYPTDTAYGLGVSAVDSRSIDRLFVLKGRDPAKPIHVVVRDWEMVEAIARPDRRAKKLFAALLPGPLTIVIPKRPVIPDSLTGGRPTIGIRLPDHPFTRALSQRFSHPYTATSANRSGGVTPYSPDEVLAQLPEQDIDLLVDAGPLPHTAPSTVVELSGKEPVLIREGPISIGDIYAALR